MYTDPADDCAVFSYVWRVVSGAGWSSKRPTGRSLSDLFQYIPPGGDSNGTEGIDYFLGEQALLEHYRRTFVDSKSATDGALSKRPNANNDVDKNVTNPCVSSEVNLNKGDYVRDDVGRPLATSGDDVDCENTALRGINCHESVCDGAGSTYRDFDGAASAGTTPKPSSCDVPAASVASVEDHLPHPDHHASTASPGTLAKCAVCNMECSTERSCTWCNKLLHHFCSHDICVSLNIPDPNGRFAKDFGDSCYCSPRCYTNATKLMKHDERSNALTHHPMSVLTPSVATSQPSAASTATQPTTNCSRAAINYSKKRGGAET
ncbi:unnamed protein product [Phytophthora fragariaefolia]|uniref:Unnamed protein product n=1 Tax=Phytophthora fragariaefolia TaxID=1490495 RepID=A0A9W7CVF5_9STRA|nr:unnamed protein product [Phytophthora fragariaefolia]